MCDAGEKTDLKIVDFGLSKIIGPNETSLDPFGTLVSSIIASSNIFLCRVTLPQKFCFRSLMAKKWTFGPWESSSTFCWPECCPSTTKTTRRSPSRRSMTPLTSRSAPGTRFRRPAESSSRSYLRKTGPSVPVWKKS